MFFLRAVAVTHSTVIPLSVYFLSLRAMAPSSSSTPPTKCIVEYAKSNRSSCKKCSDTIAAKTLRLGLVTRDARGGFDMTKWHHLQCFPFDSHPDLSLEKITGYASLQSDDQEALKITIGGTKRSAQEALDGDNDAIKESDVKDSKHAKLSTPDEPIEVEIPFSVSDVKDKYKNSTLSPKWKAFQTVIFLERDEGLHDSKKIAAFDFDGCLAKTHVRRVGADAWSLMYPSIPKKLQSLYNDGYKLVIFTNESNIERWKNKRQVAIDSKIGRLNNFIKLVNVPIQVFIACGASNAKPEDPFRKPKPGMWHILEKHFNSGIPIDMDQSFYVGDAAGRPDDHSDADIKFAEANGLKFYVPEEYFDA